LKLRSTLSANAPAPWPLLTASWPISNSSPPTVPAAALTRPPAAPAWNSRAAYGTTASVLAHAHWAAPTVPLPVIGWTRPPAPVNRIRISCSAATALSWWADGRSWHQLASWAWR
jgi:hypothetical protein